MKAAIKFDRLNWCKYVDDNLKSQLAKFWNSVSWFMKSNSTSIQSEVNSVYLVESAEVAEAFAMLLNSVYYDFSPWVLYPDFMFNHFSFVACCFGGHFVCV